MILLLAGLGPYFKSHDDLTGSFFDQKSADSLHRNYRSGGRPGFALDTMVFQDDQGRVHPLLRRQSSGSLSLVVGEMRTVEVKPIPNLVAFTLRSILHGAELEHRFVPLDEVWEERSVDATDDVDVVLLSTTFICDRLTLARAVRWVTRLLPGRPLVVGGQFSNLKYRQVLRDHPEVSCVVRGDAEQALPQVIAALRAGRPLDGIPNVAHRPGPREVALTPVDYIDLDAHPSPVFPGEFPVVPYESMRGCPFTCKFCSFPAASPRWRYKSAEKIKQDWTRYRDTNGARHIRAMDSTFTVPPRRLRQLLDLLPDADIGWEAFTRANSLLAPGIIDKLAAAHCRTLSIGFESMSDNSLSYMDKRVRANQNREAFQLLHDSEVGYRISFMAGYPGETPADYGETHDFLTQEYAGHFQLYVFSLQDETMPVWADAERFQLRVDDQDDPDYAWSHIGMDVATARELRRETLRTVRRDNADAVPLLWQTDVQTPLLPHRDAKVNLRVEKLVERLGMLPLDCPDPDAGVPVLESLLSELRTEGVFRTASQVPAAAG
jgi:anaerobic magnesium-protoporphyrin IX monomethyl ester cyclase